MQENIHGAQAPESPSNGATGAGSMPDDSYDYGDSYEAGTTAVEDPKPAAPPAAPPPPVSASGGKGKPPAPPSGGGGDDGGDGEDDGMLRMSFLEHLEELRSRILKALAGVGVAFALALFFANDLWKIVSAPATAALHTLGFTEKLVQITPMETFTTVWVKLPMLASIFLASPWILYQVWAFVAPGLYRRERRWAAPFVICSAGLFITGGLFGYFIAFRYGLTFLLGIGRDINIQPMVSVTEYFDLFVNVMLGIGLIFELPILIFFLTLLHIVTPSFLIRHSRYAILIIVILAAIVTPTPDVFNLMLFAVPMCLLYFVGIFAGYLLVLHREHRRFPWKPTLKWTGLVLLILAGVVYLMVARYGFHIVAKWPFLTK